MPPTGDATFVSLRDLGPNLAEESISTTIGDVIAGRNYLLTIHSMTSLSNNDATVGTFYYSGTYIDQFEVQFNSDPRIAITSITQETWGTDTIAFTGDPDINGNMTFTIYPGSNSAYVDPVSDPERELWESVHISIEANAIEDIKNPDTDGDGIRDAADTDVELGNPTLVRFLDDINNLAVTGEVGIATDAPHPSSVLEVVGTDKGLLVPNVALRSSSDTVTIPRPTVSLMVYNTNDTTSLAAGLYSLMGLSGFLFVKNEWSLGSNTFN